MEPVTIVAWVLLGYAGLCVLYNASAMWFPLPVRLTARLAGAPYRAPSLIPIVPSLLLLVAWVLGPAWFVWIVVPLLMLDPGGVVWCVIRALSGDFRDE